MISFFICVGVLVLGYYTYGVVCERIFGIDHARPTPAMEMADGVDYVPRGVRLLLSGLFWAH